VSALVLLVVFSSSVLLMRNAFSAAVRAELFSSSVLAVQSKMEELRLRSFDELRDLGAEEFDSGSGSVCVRPITGDLILIEATYFRPSLEVATYRSRF